MAQSLPKRDWCCGVDLQSFRGWALILLLSQVLVSVATAFILAFQLDHRTFGLDSARLVTQGSCALGAPDSSDTWVCGLTWIAAAVGFCIGLLLIFIAGQECCGRQSKLWYRGGCWKVTLTFLLLVGTLLWLVTASIITYYARQANAHHVPQQGWRETAIALAWASTLLFLVSLALRVADQGGSVKRSELDVLEAQDAAAAGKGFVFTDGRHELTWGRDQFSRDRVSPENAILHRFQSQYDTSSYFPGTKDPNDRIFLPNHPQWYGSWLVLPREIDLTMPSVLDQGHVGTCAVNAVANAYCHAVRKGGKPTFHPSRIFMFFTTKYNIMKQRPEDGGAYLRAVCKALNKYGCCSETTYPYLPEMLHYMPPPAAFHEAERHRVSYYKVEQTEYDICSALAQGHPIVLGIQFVLWRLEKYAGDPRHPIVDYPTEAELELIRSRSAAIGSHAVTLVGYNRKTRTVKFQNSWGSTWGLHGYFFAPLDYVLNPELACDLWMFRYAH